MENKSFILGGIAALLIGLASGYYWFNAGEAELADAGCHHLSGEDADYARAEDSHMHSAMADMNAALQGKKGDALDAAFLDEMIVHHEGALEMAELLRIGTNRPELVKLAENIIAAQTAEIEMMKRWRTEWFGR